MTDTTSLPVAYLDANVFIFVLEGTAAVAERVRPLLDKLRAYPGVGITSELTLAEVLAGSDRPRDAATKRAYLDLIVWSGFIDLIPVNRSVLYESVDLRLAHRQAHGKKLDLPDAIHLSTAIQRRCRYFISGDEGIVPPNEMKRLSPITGNLEEVVRTLS
jgi:predicted nucleic acid-binding protein